MFFLIMQNYKKKSRAMSQMRKTMSQSDKMRYGSHILSENRQKFQKY